MNDFDGKFENFFSKIRKTVSKITDRISEDKKRATVASAIFLNAKRDACVDHGQTVDRKSTVRSRHSFEFRTTEARAEMSTE